MADDLVTGLLPSLGQSSKAGFNVFDVMRHGTHEKQISNVFGWLLDTDGTHCLEDLFQRIFVDEVNRRLTDQEPFPYGPWAVRQEVDTWASEDGKDIADLVLDREGHRLVIENYVTSDGRAHNYDRYMNFSQTADRRGAVILLCRYEDDSRKTDGWEKAVVVTYDRLVTELRQSIASDYPGEHPEAYSFIDQMHRKFVAGSRRMEDNEILEFVTVMCGTGEALRYRDKDQKAAKRKLAEDVAKQAVERFDDGRELLQRIKSMLQTYCKQVLRAQLNETLGPGFITSVSARWAGIFQWTINLGVAKDTSGEEGSDDVVQVVFGPSAWFTNERETQWRHKVEPGAADYSHLFLTARWQYIQQSAVTLQEVLDGLAPNDHRLHDEIVQLLKDSGPAPARQRDD